MDFIFQIIGDEDTEVPNLCTKEGRFAFVQDVVQREPSFVKTAKLKA